MKSPERLTGSLPRLRIIGGLPGISVQATKDVHLKQKAGQLLPQKNGSIWGQRRIAIWTVLPWHAPVSLLKENRERKLVLGGKRERKGYYRVFSAVVGDPRGA